MPRGGARKGAGRPKLSKEEKLNREMVREYRKYSFRFDEAKKTNPYGMSNKMTFSEFKRSLDDKREEGAAHPIQAIIKEQRLYSKKQSSAWARNLNKHLKEWEERGGAPSEKLQEIMDILKGRSRIYADDFYNIWDKRIDEIITIINNFDLWEEAVGS